MILNEQEGIVNEVELNRVNEIIIKETELADRYRKNRTDT
ncbi:hypothetical protein C5S31_01685 [ANME-1 cluster archaeon GoMg2]|nr:hypothetical protein [ANME-1 cluster archaeon GoMg2]